MRSITHRYLLRLAQVSAFAVFLGRAWQHLVWDAPYRALFWDESLMRPLVETILGWEWHAYVTSPATDLFITRLVTFSGLLYLLGAVAVWTVERLPKLSRFVLIAGGINLVLLAALYYKEHFYFTGQFFEYTLQWSSPFFLIALSRSGRMSDRLLLTMKVAIALTFTCHGLYAVGAYPRPGYFVHMTMAILGVGNAGAELFLRWAGILDFVISVLIFLPGRWSLPPLAYAFAWGLATTLARVWAHFYPEFWPQVLKQWLHESLYRFPHFLVPLLVGVFIWRRSRRGKT